MPFVALFKFDAPPEMRDVQRQSLHEKTARMVLNADCGPSEATLIVGIAEPRELNLYREGDDFSPPFDLAIKAEYPNSEAFVRNMETSGLPGMFASYSAYRTEETVKKNLHPSEPRDDRELPGVRMLHPLRFHPDLPLSALLRSWRDVHGDLAIKAHSGAEYYAQLLVVEKLVPDSPDYGGFSEFQFPSRDALITGYFASDTARQAVRHDIRHFIDGVPPRLFGTAYQWSKRRLAASAITPAQT